MCQELKKKEQELIIKLAQKHKTTYEVISENLKKHIKILPNPYAFLGSDFETVFLIKNSKPFPEMSMESSTLIWTMTCKRIIETKFIQGKLQSVPIGIEKEWVLNSIK